MNAFGARRVAYVRGAEQMDYKSNSKRSSTSPFGRPVSRNCAASLYAFKNRHFGTRVNPGKLGTLKVDFAVWRRKHCDALLMLGPGSADTFVVRLGRQVGSQSEFFTPVAQ